MDEQALIGKVRDELSKVIHGKPGALDLLLVGVLGGGHVLVEDVPGVGKTTLAKAFARTFEMTFTRVQFTPDLLPADILGSQVLNPKEGTFAFHAGPIFTHVLLADEINRASPRTQSALLEAMNESQATLDGVTRPLPDPFFVIATQNPVDYHGTYPLPEAQLDRFLLRIAMGYPAFDDELRMLFSRKREDPLLRTSSVANAEDLSRLRAKVREIEVKDSVARYLLHLVEKTRDHPELELGISPRGALAFFRAVQARAMLEARSYVSPEDVQVLAVPVLGHRLKLSANARYAGVTEASIVSRIVESVSVPA